ncbi:branched-chain amino acid transport system ATP-binding protein [Alkalispirillum mobile]|uniref:Branched-chain amino acid transport system ATP-binding protein n=1 Tax=Alkalispirillum mobile TaxID=85925 RepID=A0A498C0V0_9GAMM|nr:ABC transporter ATP-binding protein [Alkalispirillum mobile]RLK48729.1 branched-chain amino acid transport system ATP-binding protein [Alkalispirillum mobile]
MSEPLLDIRNLRAGYRTPVVGPFSLQARAGEIIGLTGPNGCGKSTVLKAVTGEARIFDGHIERDTAAGIALQAQSPATRGEIPLTGGELLRLMGHDGRGLPPRLDRLTRRRIDRLSGGQRQILAVWAVLYSGARLILLDEPGNNLDREGTELLADALTALPADRAVLMVSHEQHLVERVCHRVVDMEASAP